MIVMELTPFHAYQVRTSDGYDNSSYIRFDKDLWYCWMGESLEPVYDCEVLEKYFERKIDKANKNIKQMSADVKVHRNDMSVDIYRVVDKSGSSFIHNEVCRDCAVNFRKKGFNIEFDDHLSKFIYIVDGMTFYADGSDDEDEEITCSICGEPLVSGLSQLSSDVKEN